MTINKAKNLCYAIDSCCYFEWTVYIKMRQSVFKTNKQEGTRNDWTKSDPTLNCAKKDWVKVRVTVSLYQFFLPKISKNRPVMIINRCIKLRISPKENDFHKNSTDSSSISVFLLVQYADFPSIFRKVNFNIKVARFLRLFIF